MGQGFITNWGSFVLWQIGTSVITNWGSYYKFGQILLQIRAAITNWGITGVGEEGYDANKVGKNEIEIVISLKHLSNFWKSLNILLINCELELILTWSKNCVFTDMTVRAAQVGNPAIVAPTGLEFKITDTKLYVPVVTLSKENDIKLLEQLKSGFKRTMKRNK